MKKSSFIAKLYIAVILIILFAPIAVLMVFSFNSGKSTAVFSGFSFKWYTTLLNNGEALSALRNSVILAVSSSVISTVMGTFAAYGINRMRGKYLKSSVMTLTNIPMMNPDIITGISLMLMFVFVGTMLGLVESLSFVTMLIAHVTFGLPYVIMSVLPKFSQMDKSMPEAALDLGCTPLQTFFKVELPEIMPGIMTGGIMAFTMSLDDFVISYYTQGSSFQTLPVYIYSMVKKSVKPDICALSTLIFITILILLAVTNLISSRDERRQAKMNKALRRGSAS